jgi:WD40 repeat protein
VFIWDADSGASIAEYRGHSAAILRVAFSPEGDRVASGGEDGTIQLRDTVKMRSDELSGMRLTRRL